MAESADLVIRGATVVTPERALGSTAVALAGGKISYLGRESGAPTAGSVVEAGGGYLLPGFVDLHLHGGGGFDAGAGRWDPGAESFDGSETALREGVRAIADAHAAHGTTALLPATSAAPEEELLRSLAALGEEAPRTGSDAGGGPTARVLGVNLEGCYIKDPAFAGAMNPDFFRPPSVEDFERLNEVAAGRIRIVNIAPEHGEAAVGLVRHLVKRGVVAAAGHTGADREQTLTCIDAGLSLAVHFSNGPMSTSFKPPGMVMETMLADERVTLELIADGHHVNPGYLLSFLAAKRFRAALITDALLVAGAPHITRFTRNERTAVLSDDRGVMRLAGHPTLLVGSVLTLSRAVANLVRWLAGGVHGVYQNAAVIDPPPSKEEALVLASRLASGIPAEVLGLRRELGAIEKGLAADLVLLGENFSVRRVWVGGREVARPTEEA